MTSDEAFKAALERGAFAGMNPPKPEATGFVVRVRWANDSPGTIWNRLAEKLGRPPTDAEAAAEVRRILETSK